MTRTRKGSRRGVAAVELAILLPFLAFMFVIAVDWARIFYYSVTITNYARQGALYGSDPIAMTQSPYTSIQQAALADGPSLSPQPTVTSSNGIDGSGNSYVAVTVSWPFSTLTNFPGVPTQVNLSRTVQMRVAPTIPR